MSDSSSSSSVTTMIIPAPKILKLFCSDIRRCHRRCRRCAQPLLPGLPDHIAHLCLSRLHPSVLFSVCLSWRNFIYSSAFPPFMCIYSLLSSSIDSGGDAAHFFSFDPIQSQWLRLPPPTDPPLRLLLTHPSFLSRRLPVQSLAVAGQLVVLAATTHGLAPALHRPLVFNPMSRTWRFGPRLSAPRRWCAAGTLGGAVYVAGGMGGSYSLEVAKTVERWDVRNDVVEKKGRLRDVRMSREAIEAVGWRGKLWMVNVKGGAAKEGAVYDVVLDVWEDMPEGMLGGWRGPAAAMATATADGAEAEEMYVVDEEKGILRRYDEDCDSWKDVAEAEVLRGAEYMAAGGGRVVVVSGGGGMIVVVDVVASPPRIWVVHTPEGLDAVAVHVLPRMSHCTD